jgi:hypothetical protein
MGGGTSIWASPEARSDPRAIFNGRLAYTATTIAFAGCAYGFDQGNIGGVLTLPTFKHAFGLDQLSEDAADHRAGNIAALSAYKTCPLGQNRADGTSSGRWRCSRSSHQCPIRRFSWSKMVHDALRHNLLDRLRFPRGPPSTTLLRRSISGWSGYWFYVGRCATIPCGKLAQIDSWLDDLPLQSDDNHCPFARLLDQLRGVEMEER